MAEEDKTYEVYDKEGKLRRVKASNPDDAFDKLDANPSQRTWAQTGRAAAGQFLQGVPFVDTYAAPAAAKFREILGRKGGDYEHQLEALKNSDESFRNDNPLTSAGLRMAGTAAATAPAMPALSAAAGPGLFANMGMQGLFGGALGSADEAVKQYHEGKLGDENSNRKITSSGLMNGLFSTLGPLAGKLITPGHLEKLPPNYTNEAAKEGSSIASNRAAQGATNAAAEEAARNAGPKTLADQVQQAKDAVNNHGFEDLLKNHFPTGKIEPTPFPNPNFEQAASNVVNRTHAQPTHQFVPPTEATRDAITHGIPAVLGGALGAEHSPVAALIGAGLGAGNASHLQALGSAALRGVGLHPERYWNNKFMVDHPGSQDILNILAQTTGKETNRKILSRE